MKVINPISKEAVLIIAHGSKVKETDEIMKKYHSELISRASLSKKNNEDSILVEYCYLQLMEPSIEDIVEKLYNQNVRLIKAFPFFLFNGNHIKEDIPEVLENLANKYEGLEFEFLSHIGFDSRLCDLIEERIGL